MDGITIKPGWADKLKEGSPVIVRDRVVSSARPSTSYRLAKVDRVTATEVHVGDKRYRRGRGRSKYEALAYQNEGMDIDMLSEVTCGSILPANAATRRWLDEATAADAEADALVTLVMQVRTAVDDAFKAGDSAKLKAAHKALTRK